MSICQTVGTFSKRQNDRESVNPVSLRTRQLLTQIAHMNKDRDTTQPRQTHTIQHDRRWIFPHRLSDSLVIICFGFSSRLCKRFHDHSHFPLIVFHCHHLSSPFFLCRICLFEKVFLDTSHNKVFVSGRSPRIFCSFFHISFHFLHFSSFFEWKWGDTGRDSVGNVKNVLHFGNSGECKWWLELCDCLNSDLCKCVNECECVCGVCAVCLCMCILPPIIPLSPSTHICFIDRYRQLLRIVEHPRTIRKLQRLLQDLHTDDTNRGQTSRPYSTSTTTCVKDMSALQHSSTSPSSTSSTCEVHVHEYVLSGSDWTSDQQMPNKVESHLALTVVGGFVSLFSLVLGIALRPAQLKVLVVVQYALSTSLLHKPTEQARVCWWKETQKPTKRSHQWARDPVT
jgi:hypothetical protein